MKPNPTDLLMQQQANLHSVEIDLQEFRNEFCCALEAATTNTCYSACYFNHAAEKLDGVLAKLVDMQREQ